MGPSAHNSSEGRGRMDEELDHDDGRHLPGYAVKRPERDRHAEGEQRAGRGGVLQELHQPVERDRRLEPQRRRGNPERGRNDERVQHDLADDVERGRAPALCCRVPTSAIMNGTSENSSSVSKQKISATGTAACGPSVASASPGPI